MDDFDLEIKTEFINEALMNLEEAEGSFMELESSQDTKPLLDKIFRLAHNLKGGSRAVGFGQVAEFTHQLENLVLKIQKGEIVLNSDIVTTLLRSNDRLVEMLSALKADMSASFDNKDLMDDIEGWLNGSKVASTPSPSPSPEIKTPEVSASFVTPQASVSDVATVVSASAETAEVPVLTSDAPEIVQNEKPPVVPSADAIFGSELESKPSETPIEITAQSPPQAPTPVQMAPVPAAKTEANKASEQKSGEDEVIRVNLSRIDLLNDYVGELIVLQSVVQQQSSGDMRKLQASLRQMVKLSKDIQSLSMSLRMLPVKPLVQKLQRVVRDTARALDKDVVLDVIGEQMEVDKSVLDRLSDPLIHILRNAVDHGLETTAERTSAGKKPQGKVTLAFLTEGNHLVVEVSDDGKGINGEVLRKKAIEKKLITESQQLTDKQIINLIFHPGFSTKTVTSEISGRGVGMDVVKTNVEKIGGQIDIQTVVGKGSVFRLQIPLSLAVIDGLVVTSDKGRYVIPLNQVQETVNLKTQKVYSGHLGVGYCFELRGNVVPLFSLEDVLNARASQARKQDGTALIVNSQDHLMGIVVDEIIRAQQIVIKPLGNGILTQKGWVGSCVLGDGLPTLILSPVDLLSGKIRFGQNEKVIEAAS